MCFFVEREELPALQSRHGCDGRVPADRPPAIGVPFSTTMQRQLNEVVKHGAAAADAARPERADWTIDQNWDKYTDAEHAVWKTLFERQSALLPRRACDEFVEGMRDLPIDAQQIPDFRALSDVLMRRTGWQVVAVPGLGARRDLLRASGEPALSRRPLHPQAARARLSGRAGYLPRCVRPCADAHESDDRRLHPSLRRGRSTRAAARQAHRVGTRILVHGRVRADRAGGRRAHLRMRVSHPLSPRACLRWTIRHPIASASISSASCARAIASTTFRKAIS